MPVIFKIHVSFPSLIHVSLAVKQKVAAKKSAEFFSPKSFVDGFVNNALGVAGFVQTAAKADDAFEARMAREAALAAKVKAAKERKAKGMSE